MAPKKTVLLLLTAFLLTGLATANTFEDAPESEIWLNEDNPEASFTVSYSDSCESDRRTVILDSDDNQVASFDDSEQYKVENDDGSTSYDYSYEFSETGSYSVQASCTPKTENGNELDVSNPKESVQVGNLELGLENLPDETVYEGNSFEGNVVVETNNENLESDLNYGYTFVDEGGNLDDETGDLTVDNSGLFTRPVSDSDYESFEVSASNNNLGFSVEASQGLDVQDVWQVAGLTVSAGEEIDDDDLTVKYRDLDSLRMDFTVTKEGEGVPGFGSGDFFLDGEEEWFSADDRGNGDYRLDIDGRPVMDDLEVDDQNVLDIDLEDEKVSDGSLDIADVTVEKDVEFSGRVLDISNNRVDTEFEALYDGRIRSFQTDDSGRFQRFISTEKVDMVMDFPEATVSLTNMNVDREDPGDISYNYYESFEEASLDVEGFPEGVRPVNLGAFISNYHFDGDSVDTFVDMNFDTGDIRPEDAQVYECNEWTFRAESCSGDWERIDNNDVTLEAGATWSAEFPITPRESDRFASDKGVLSNAYLVGVPRGTGSSLALGGEPSYSSSSIQSGGQFEFSGTVIDGSTNRPVEGAEVEYSLVSDSNEVSDTVSTNSEGEFEFSETLNQAGDYEIEVSASKSPYESFTWSESDLIEVYYDTGLSVSSESNPEVGLGEDYDITYTVENVGQKAAEGLEFSVSGVDDYSLSPESVSELGSGDSQDVTLTVNLPENLRTPPNINFEATGTSNDKEVKASSSTLTSFSDDVDLTASSSDDEESTGESETNQQEDQSSSNSIPSGQEISRMTGEFIESQSQMNLALGLILVFAAILAVAVKNKDEDSRDMRGRGQGRGQSRVQAPQVAPQEDGEDESEQKEASDESSGKESEKESSESSEESSDEESDSVECDVCGETFDTESGMNLHKQALH